MMAQYQSCTGKPASTHELQDFSPTSRFRPGEVQELLFDLETVPHALAPTPFVMTSSIAEAMSRADANREVIKIRRKELTNELFAHLFSGDDPYPLVIVPDPGEKIFQYPWDAAFFGRVFIDSPCEIEDCATGIKSPSTVGEFFNSFGKDDATEKVSRLKVVLCVPIC